MKILFVGLGGVPYSKRAADIRLRFFADAVRDGGNEAVVLNRYPFPQTGEPRGGFSKIVELFSPKRKKSLILYVLAYFKEFWAILKENRIGKIDVLHVYSGHFIDLIFYCLVSRVIGAKTVYSYVEFRSGIPQRGLYSRINASLIDRWGVRFADGVIPISTFLEEHAKKIRGENFLSCKVPPICDFEYFSTISKNSDCGKYILFCGSAEYREVIDLILAAYLKATELKKTTRLKLVLGGKKEARELLRREYPSDVEIVSGLPYEDLVKAYKGAEALLIPLRDTIQDSARFPNKVCEYVASRGLVVTTRFGEMPYFFEDGKNALVADDFSAEALAEKLSALAKMPDEKREEIRNVCYQSGRAAFDYRAYVEPLKYFFERVCREN